MPVHCMPMVTSDPVIRIAPKPKNFMVCLAICLEDSMRNRLIPTVNMSNYGHSLLVIVSNN